MTDWSTFKYKDFLNFKENEINNLPDGVSISTMCATCKLGTIINILNIEKYLQLNNNDILCVKMNDTKIRTLIPAKEKNKRRKKNDKPEKIATTHFYNQITIIIRIGSGPIIDWEKEPKINLKLFKNGSVQMSGCKTVKNINIVLNKLINKLSEIKYKELFLIKICNIIDI